MGNGCAWVGESASAISLYVAWEEVTDFGGENSGEGVIWMEISSFFSAPPLDGPARLREPLPFPLRLQAAPSTCPAGRLAHFAFRRQNRPYPECRPWWREHHISGLEPPHRSLTEIPEPHRRKGLGESGPSLAARGGSCCALARLRTYPYQNRSPLSSSYPNRSHPRERPVCHL